MTQQLNSYRTGPDERGRFGIHGGRFVAETLMPLLLEIEQAYEDAKRDPTFKAELDHYLTDYVGRPSPLYLAERLTEHLGGCKVYFKREELNHTGAHKINSCVAQILLARRMGKTRIIAETGAGQHGVATATVCARFGLECVDLHGRARHRAAAAERLPHAPARGRGPPGQLGLAHAQGRDERGPARLGDERPRHLLPDRHRRRTAPLPRHGARLPARDRRGDPRPDPGEGGPAARPPGRRGRRRLERHGAVPPLPRRPRGPHRRRRGGGPRDRDRRARRRHDGRPPRRAARRPLLPAPGRQTAR